MVVGKRLHDHPGAVLGKRLANVRRRPYRISHIMQAIEDRHKVVVAPWETLCGRHFKCDAVLHAVFPRGFTRSFDRLIVIVESYESRPGECLRHQDGGRAFSATDVSNVGTYFEFLFYTVQCRNPGVYKIGGVAGPKELLATVEHSIGVFMPAHALASAE